MLVKIVSLPSWRGKYKVFVFGNQQLRNSDIRKSQLTGCIQILRQSRIFFLWKNTGFSQFNTTVSISADPQKTIPAF